VTRLLCLACFLEECPIPSLADRSAVPMLVEKLHIGAFQRPETFNVIDLAYSAADHRTATDAPVDSSSSSSSSSSSLWHPITHRRLIQLAGLASVYMVRQRKKTPVLTMPNTAEFALGL